MSRRLQRLTVDTLAALPPACRTCLFWEYDAVHRARITDEDAARSKEAWLSEVLREWGSCGQAVLVDDVVAGYVVYAPPAFVPGAGGFPTAPVSQDAVLLATAYVDPRLRGGGLGRMLIQAMARDLAGRKNVHAVEGFAAHTTSGTGCVLPEDFWLAVGFKTQRAHPAYPRMRMDLRSTVSWREEIETVLERVLGAVRPVPKPRGQAGAQARTALKG